MFDISLTKEAIEEKAFEIYTQMKQVYLRSTNIKVRVFMSKSFSRFSFLTVINLSYTSLENGGAIVLVNALKNSAPSLEVVNIAGNNITDEAAQAIVACLAAKRHMKKLNLSDNALKDEGCLEIVTNMEDMELEYVDMSYNELRREAALGLAYVVVKKESFKMLNIDRNVISIKGIEEIKVIFKNCPQLSGEENEDHEDIEDNDLREMRNLEAFEDEFVSEFFFY